MQNFGGLAGQNGQSNACILDNSLRKKGHLWYRRSLKGNGDRHQQNTATLPRGWKQTKQSRCNSLVDYSDPQRTTLLLEKQDNENFGFEIQTYGLQLRNAASMEMCTFVCAVQKDSAADSAGLTTGDVIVTINGLSIEGSSHHHVVDLIRQSTNLLKLETVCGTIVKRIELEKKMNLLKQTLREKWVELQGLTLQERRLLRGSLNDCGPRPSTDSLVSVDSPSFRDARRFSSESSYRSATTEDGEQASVFGDALSSPLSAASAADDHGCFFSGDFSARRGGTGRTSSGLSVSSSSSSPHLRSRSSSSSFTGSSSSLSPAWEETRASTLFGTLPRKGRRTSVRKHILKLIPGLQRSVEEEELGPGAQAETQIARQGSLTGINSGKG